jgi:hypothetical protein
VKAACDGALKFATKLTIERELFPEDA